MKRILVISPIPTHPQIAGNRARILRLIESMREMGHDVHFLCVNTEPEKTDEHGMRTYWGSDRFYFVPYVYPKRSLGRYLGRVKFIFERGARELLPVDYRYDPSLDTFLRELTGRIHFDVIVVEYIFWSRAFESFDSGVLKILDTHDVFTRRHLLYHGTGQEYGWYCTSAGEEAKALNRSDVVIAIQGLEKEYFSTLTRKKVITVRHIAPLLKPTPTLSEEKRILFVGSDAGTNILGIRHFLTETFPRIRAVFPALTLMLVGKVCNAVEDADGCVRMGEVKDLTAVYNNADAVVNPIGFSTGLSIKTIEALGYGRPVVTTPSGSKGMEDGAGRAFLMADAPEEFAALVVRVLQDPDLARELSHNAYAFVERWNRESLRELGGILNDD